ncbi:hypothetical protein [Arthrobacter sp. zg-Y1143]|uniref:hypothetical protein n=1 Tax=Arthrobacter sp. zg-Y1143 TaxID=3049065 RepID=UPI0024C40B94|nr:hypothetical protein [Arthrobacter sp. zg-Y1143]MDK1327205.1 hypothetical protein [Arthrobacter sp. zg-Y1143]
MADQQGHPQRGRMYTLDELNDLAEEGDPWAMGKVDEWEQHFANEYLGNMKDRCPDEDCDQFGEPVTICYGEDGQILDIDHGGWGHGPARDKAAAESERRAS